MVVAVVRSPRPRTSDQAPARYGCLHRYHIAVVPHTPERRHPIRGDQAQVCHPAVSSTSSRKTCSYRTTPRQQHNESVLLHRPTFWMHTYVRRVILIASLTPATIFLESEIGLECGKKTNKQTNEIRNSERDAARVCCSCLSCAFRRSACLRVGGFSSPPISNKKNDGSENCFLHVKHFFLTPQQTIF